MIERADLTTHSVAVASRENPEMIERTKPQSAERRDRRQGGEKGTGGGRRERLSAS